eukprot:9144870-Pyramimonas_sp.AAC.1
MGRACRLATTRLAATRRFIFCLPVPKPSDNDTSKFDEAAFVAAHWWVATTCDKKQANMATSHVSRGGIMLPALTNITDIGPNVKLHVFVKPQAKAAPIHEESAKKQKRS